MSKPIPSMDHWLQEAKHSPDASRCGMFLTHNGVVRQTARALVRNGDASATAPVIELFFSSDSDKVAAAISETKSLPGIYYVKVWLNEGRLAPGDDIMYVLVGGDIRPHVIDALQFLVGKIKSECVIEQESFS